MSSYAKNNYCQIFGSLLNLYKPKLVVELGVLDGYSLSCMVDGYPDNSCQFIGIDLFENYTYKNAHFEDIKDFFGADDNVEVRQKNAYDAADDFEDNSIDMLHIDLSNTGQILEDIFDLWSSKVKKEGLVIFEGGSRERDEVEWMIEYDKPAIEEFKYDYLNSNKWEYITLTPYPSLTICRKVH